MLVTAFAAVAIVGPTASASATAETQEQSTATEVTPTEDAVDRVLGSEVSDTDDDDDGTPRWDPPWLAWMTTLAVVLVGLAASWWLFAIVRVQDRLRR